MLVAWPSLAIERIADGAAGFFITRDQTAIIVAAPMLSQCLMPIILGFILKRFGRKTNLIANAVIFIVAWCLITMASSPLSLIIANLSAGLGSSILIIIGPIYIAEIADKRIRGALISLFITAIAIGEVFSTGVGIFVSYFQLNLIALALSAVALISIIFTATESPSYHFMVNKEEDAEKSFRYYWNSRSTGDDREVSSSFNRTLIFV